MSIRYAFHAVPAMHLTYQFDVREKIFETCGTNHTEQTSKLIYGNSPTAAAAVLSMAFVIVIYRIESISINSEKEEKYERYNVWRL